MYSAMRPSSLDLHRVPAAAEPHASEFSGLFGRRGRRPQSRQLVCNSFAIAISLRHRSNSGGDDMRFWLQVIAAGVAGALIGSAAGYAAGNLAGQQPIEVTVDLGKPGQHAFVPNSIKFETGKLYKLILRNPSDDPHYFTSHGFSQMIYHPQGPGGADARRQDRQRSPSSRARSARSRSIRATARNGGSCRWRPAASPTCAAASSARTASRTPTTAWSARSSSSDAANAPAGAIPGTQRRICSA